MIKTLSLVRNVGKFDNVATGASIPFAKLTLVYAENGRGKTTLAAIFRSLATGRAHLVTERRRVASVNTPLIVIDIDKGQSAIFQHGTWSQTHPEIAVFDDAFIAENVCSGIEVSATHRQNLHELVIGAEGVALNGKLQAHIAAIEQHNKDLRELGDQIPVQRRGGFDVDKFCDLRPISDLQRVIENAERRLAAGRNADSVAQAPMFPVLALPLIDTTTVEHILNKDIINLDAEALENVSRHVSCLGQGAENWISKGLQFFDGLAAQGRLECPFCAQGLRTAPILDHYRAYFGEAYNRLKTDIGVAARKFETAQSGDIPAAFERSVRQAVERQTYWGAFAEVPVVKIETTDIAVTWKRARESIELLFQAKSANPLEPIQISDEVRKAVAKFNARSAAISITNAELQETNNRLKLVKEQAADANVAVLVADLSRLRAVEARYDPLIVPLCERYIAEKTAKARTERARQAARKLLDDHRGSAFSAYGAAINDFLQRLNASFRIGPVDPVNTRQGSSANYTLIIEGNPIPLTTADIDPCFRNTLSAGDRSTLALAFFFASLHTDPRRGSKIVVIDDPMTSLDEHRTLHTRQEMDRLAREVSGMIVLSHSKPFLAAVWDKCKQMQKAALEVRRAGSGSTFAVWDISDAMVTEHDRRHIAALGYLGQQADPGAARRVAESLRPMLEAFARVAYPKHFPPGALLGTFYNVCLQKAGSAEAIMQAAEARELRAILDFANRFHHDTNPAYATELTNDSELTDFTRRTLAFTQRPRDVPP